MDKNRTSFIAAGREKLNEFRKKKDKGKGGKGKDGKGASKSSKKPADNSKLEDKDKDANAVSAHDETFKAESSQPSLIEHQSDASLPENPSLHIEGTSLDHGHQDGEQVHGAEVGDQVAVQAGDQEAYNIDSTHIDRQLERDRGDELLVSKSDGGGEVPSDADSLTQKLIVPDQSCDVPVIDNSDCEHDQITLEASVPVEAANLASETLILTPGNLHQQVDGMMDSSSSGFQQLNQYEEMNTGLDTAVAIECDKLNETVWSTSDEKNTVDTNDEQFTSAGRESKSVNLDELVEVIKGLPEGDFWHLINSRATADNGNLFVPSSVTFDIPQTFQEQLYLTNISKDFLQVELLEQQEQHSDPDNRGHPGFTASLSDLQESNKILAAELAQCRSELEAAMAERMDFQNLFHGAKDEARGFSATVDDLLKDLEKAVGNVSNLSAELVDCKVQLGTLLAENEHIVRELGSVTEQTKQSEVVIEQSARNNQKLSMELADSSAQLTALQMEVESMTADIAFLAGEKQKFEEEKDILVQEKELVSRDLQDCRHQAATLQQENSDLSKCIVVMNEEHKKRIDHEEFLIQEIEQLSVELVVLRDNLLIQHQEREHYEADLKEAMSRLEQLAEENIILQSSLEISKAKISEVESRHIQVSAGGMGFEANMDTAAVGSEGSFTKENADTVVPNVIPANYAPEASAPSELRLDFDADTPPALVIKGCFDEAENLIQKLESAAEGMHSHSVSLSRSVSRNATPGVSKLIQAFESKANTDDVDPVGSTPAGDLVPSDSYMLAKEQISHLRGVLMTLARKVEHMDALLLEGKSRFEAVDCSRGELEIEIEALKCISNNLTERNIELEVLYGAMNQHALDIEANKTQLEDLYETLKQEYAGLHSQNIVLARKLSSSDSRIGDLHVQLKGMRRGSTEVASTLHHEIETLKGDLTQDIYAFEREWKSSFAQLLPVMEKLDALVISAVGDPPASEPNNDFGILGHVSFSLTAACEVIEKLMLRINANDSLSSSYRDLTEKLCSVDEERSFALSLLQKISADLLRLLNFSAEHFDDSGSHTAESQHHKTLDVGHYEALISKLANLIDDLPQLKESNQKLYSDLLSRTNDIEELKKYCLDADAVSNLILNVIEVLKLQDEEVVMDKTPVQLMQSSVFLLVQKFKEVQEHIGVLNNDYNSQMIVLSDLQGSIEQLNSLNLQHQNEILVLRESLTQAQDSIHAVQAELLEKIKELEQSEQRVASVREKLSIAVAKGKGLVVQRDSLKHSLAEMSSELEKCSEEMRVKDSKILEVEDKLKAYSEAGERMEALESELTYIRNSATALRESFFLKDSTLQRIEEILEDLELPDHFHSRDILEKVDWLAKSVVNNSLVPADWDQQSSVGGGSHSDAGLVTDGLKEDAQPSADSMDDLRRKYDDLQAMYFKLAEQNDMLEQSLTERNILVQRWEEVLDRINTPPQIRSMEPEERIHWLGTALSEADNHMRSLQQKIEELESYCESLSSDLMGSQRRISEHESSLQAVLLEKNSALSEANDHMKSLKMKILDLENHRGSLLSDLEESEQRISEFESTLQAVHHEKEILSANVVAVTSDHALAMHTVTQYERDLDKLRKEIEALQLSLAEKLRNDAYIQQMEDDLSRLQGLILEELQDPESENESPGMGNANVQYLERLIKKLLMQSRGLKEVVQDCVIVHETNDIPVREVEKEYVPIESVVDTDEPKSRNTVYEGQLVAGLRNELAEALDEVARLRVEIDTHLQKNQSMAGELEALDRKKGELLEQLNQEEQKSASLREKLNLAVRKGKSLVQQRDSLKQNIEELMAEMDRLRSELTIRDNSILESGQKTSDLSLQIESCKAFEAENFSLRNQLVETEQQLQQKGLTLSLFLSKLGEIDAGGEITTNDPLHKLEVIQKFCSEFHAAVAASELEASKSKKAAELLLAELNEVQERNDDLQEESAKTHHEVTALRMEKDIADSAKVEALSHLAKFSEERKVQLTEFERLKSSVYEVKKLFFEFSTFAGDVFAKDLELLNNVKAHAESCLKHIDTDIEPIKDDGGPGGWVSANKRFKDFWLGTSLWNTDMHDQLGESPGFEVEQYLKQLAEAINDFSERVRGHSLSLRTDAEHFENAISTILREVVSHRNSLKSVKAEIINLESTLKERDLEGVVLRRSISLLYEACSNSVMEIESQKGQFIGESLAPEDYKVNFPSLPKDDTGILSGPSPSSTEECVKVLVDRLLKAVKDFADLERENRETGGKEMRSTILTLQKELQEKDIQRERICMELVNQIKAAESTATTCSRDLQSMRNYAHDLENKLEAVAKERAMLEQRVAELQQAQSISTDLGEKIKVLTDLLAAKDQEIEALMQALDEEENQMEALRSKIEELKRTVQQKSIDLEHVETSRAKAVKKLSVTVSKFDELHHMSEGLLSEIESLQSQLQDRDAEVSFLRQEVTRCTNDALEAMKISKERNSTDLFEFVMRLDMMLSRIMLRDTFSGDDIVNNCTECKENLQKDVMSIISELETLRTALQDKDALLQVEREKVEELSHRKEALEASLREKELHLNSLQGLGISGIGTSEIVEVEPALNNWNTPVTTTASQVRSLRKANNDQVAIAIDTDAGSSGKYEDEEDDKVHGFKSLTTSRFIPKFTRPVSDMIDGLWVSCDRALMRQPALRLGIMLYWALLHAFLASIIV